MARNEGVIGGRGTLSAAGVFRERNRIEMEEYSILVKLRIRMKSNRAKCYGDDFKAILNKESVALKKVHLT